jgi:hypothetical protein
MANAPVQTAPTERPLTPEQIAEARKILKSVKLLAATYYKITGKPLGVTGEVGEMEVADLFGLTLVPARTEGFDALRGDERTQINTRARASSSDGRGKR